MMTAENPGQLQRTHALSLGACSKGFPLECNRSGWGRNAKTEQNSIQQTIAHPDSEEKLLSRSWEKWRPTR